MMKVGNNVIQRKGSGQNHQYQQKSQIICVNNKRLLTSYVFIMYIVHKLQLYCLFMPQ
jgi:hypothetical protein